MIVDCHTHFLPADVVTADSFGTPDVPYRVRIGDAEDPDLFTATGHASGFALAQLVDPARRMADMDAQGVDVQVLSVPPPFGFFHTHDLTVSRRLCARLNEAVAAVVAAHPDRFIGLATVPMQDGVAAAEVIEHAVGELGLRGAEIATRVGDRNLDDPTVRPFFAAAARLGAAVFVHSTRGLGAERLAEYHFGNLLGNPTEDAIATASLIFGGVVDAHPDLRLYVAHGGGSCPSLAGRWDRGALVRPEARVHLTAPPSHYLRRMSFDSLTHGVEQLRLLLQVSDARHVMLGTDYPYDMGEPDPVGRIVAADLSDDDRHRILASNAATMFAL